LARSAADETRDAPKNEMLTAPGDMLSSFDKGRSGVRDQAERQ
jgi:hypothetical protein